MPSLFTSIIGGIQGAGAAHDAAKAQTAGYQQAAGSVNAAVGNANPLLAAAGSNAGAGVTDAAKTAGAGVVGAAGTAGAGVTGAAGGANDLLNPYATAGATAADKLGATAGTFKFAPGDLQNDPGYQFRMSQGLKGLANSGAAAGLGNSGAALKAAANYSQDLAGTEYQNAYQRALGTYQTNINSLLPVAGMGLTASGQSGQNLMNAAQYAGTTGLQGAEYAGNTGMQGAQYAGNAGMWSGGQQAQNLVNAGVYQGNTQIGTGNAQAQGDIGAANAWNGMLGGIGTAGNMALMGGFAPGGGGGWSPSNFGTNFGNLWSAGNYGAPVGANWGGGRPGPGGVPFYSGNPGIQGPN